MLEILKNLGDKMNHCMTIAKISGKKRDLIYVNSKFANMCEYSIEECLNKTCAFLQGTLTQKDKIVFMRKAFSENKACAVELINYKKSGKLFYNRLILFPMCFEEKKYFVGLQHEIPESKLSKVQKKSLEYVQAPEIMDKVINPLSILLYVLPKLNDINTVQKLTPEEKEKLRNSFKDCVERLGDFIQNIDNISQFEKYKY